MKALGTRQVIEDILNAHSTKAQNSAYDRDICILAILKAREVLMTVPTDADDKEYSTAVIEKMNTLFAHYHDSNGEYTSGKAVLGALRDDILCTISVTE